MNYNCIYLTAYILHTILHASNTAGYLFSCETISTTLWWYIIKDVGG